MIANKFIEEFTKNLRNFEAQVKEVNPLDPEVHVDLYKDNYIFSYLTKTHTLIQLVSFNDYDFHTPEKITKHERVKQKRN